LRGCQSARHIDFDTDIEVAVTARVAQAGHATLCQPESLTGLSAWRDGQHHIAGRRGDPGFATQNSCIEINGVLSDQIVTALFEPWIRSNLDHQIQVRASSLAGHWTLASQPNLGACARASGNLNLQAAIVNLQKAAGAVIGLLKTDGYRLLVINRTSRPPCAGTRMDRGTTKDLLEEIGETEQVSEIFEIDS